MEEDSNTNTHALAWAATESGREEFSSQFTIRNESRSAKTIFDSRGHPLSDLTRRRLPSRKWLEGKKKEALAILANEASYKAGATEIVDVAEWVQVQAAFCADITLDLVQMDGEGDASPQDTKVSTTDDAVVNLYFSNLAKLTVRAFLLQQQFPVPREHAWKALLNDVIDMAVGHGKWAFTEEVVELAMPRKFRHQDQPRFRDTVGLPRTFTPDKAISATRQIVEGTGITDRQLRCFTTTKEERIAETVTLPAIRGEWKSSYSDVDTACGQELYSIVQAAGIAQNIQCDAPLLSLVAAQGRVRPKLSCWPGKLSGVHSVEYVKNLNQADVCVVTGKDINLGRLTGMISLFLMVRNAVHVHIADAWDVASSSLGSDASEFLDHPHLRQRGHLLPNLLTPGPLVDWRTRTLPSELWESRKRSAPTAFEEDSSQLSSDENDVEGESDVMKEGRAKSRTKSKKAKRGKRRRLAPSTSVRPSKRRKTDTREV
ncbi:hypothetical protein B0H16DRAFT_1464494 [Mycena metata]|uniref:Uncharacterized protein n=1 Tax=Mycena metata TaxID=1033252 RepID=A0AAD7IG95_9AGAR|nr:hypothetical protein B0H16DRAFT_1464494 [Mycena metata]